MRSLTLTPTTDSDAHLTSSLEIFAARTRLEWTVESGIQGELFQNTVKVVADTEVDPYSHEVSYPIHEALNWKPTRFGYQARTTLYAALILNDDGEVWQVKLSHPKVDQQKRKARKYERPVGSKSRAWVPRNLPLVLWVAIAARSGLTLSEADLALGFRTWLINHPEVPVTICEGAKKAACLLSLGWAAVALPGIFNGYRKNNQGLIPDLADLATAGREIDICFDRDLKPKTIASVNLAIKRLGWLFVQQGCVVRVIQLPGPEKGVDDFVVAHGEEAFARLYSTAATLEDWSHQKLWELALTPTLELDQPFLGTLPYPEFGFAFVKSPKGSGKTRALYPLIREATRSGRRVVVITHRIQLGRSICNDLGLDWIEEMHQSQTQGLLGFGLCIDSLHPSSQARFDPQDWRGAIVILDELEQIIWHALNSQTCYEKRVLILETLKDLIQTVYSSGGLIIGQDADLSDVSVNYLMGLVEGPIVNPWVVVNSWKPQNPWEVSFYATPDPAPLMAQLEVSIETGAVFVCVDSQKASSRWGSINVEAYLKEKHPQKRILRIDSETVADPQHPACGIVERLNQAVRDYDIVIASPTIGTGVDLTVQGHFVAVFGIFQGTTPDTEARQALARVREGVPRYIWARPFGSGKIGNGSCDYREVARSTTRSIEFNLHLLREFDFDLDRSYDPITLRTWAKMAARVNSSLWDFREELRRGLAAEGHQVTVLQPGDCLPSGPVKPALAQIQEQHEQAEAEQIATAEVTEADYHRLKTKKAKSSSERSMERKYELQQSYGVEVTPDLVRKDNDGWYARLRLHYYLLNDIEAVQQRDLRELQGHLERGNQKLALQDVRLLGAQVEALRSLGLPELMRAGREIRGSDPLVQQLAVLAIEYARDLKTVLNLTFTDTMTPIQIVQALLSKLGLKLKYLKQERLPDDTRERVYQYEIPTDGRTAIFTAWKNRERAWQPSLGTPPIPWFMKAE
uniref:DUF3854 domain-containing protein n=1 Tax=Cyanothece sp. (strain PCC 7425 / ATCC 29141) TaxID=395961 RepID=B8HZR1_CYAP4